ARTGLLVPAGDAPALAAALERLLTEPQTAHFPAGPGAVFPRTRARIVSPGGVRQRTGSRPWSREDRAWPSRGLGVAAVRRAAGLFSVRREVDAPLALWDQVLDRRQTA